MDFFRKSRAVTVLSTVAVLVFFVLSCSGGRGKVVQEETPPWAALDNYIHNNDASFRWEIASHSTDDEGGVSAVVNLTSQTWQDIVWKHAMYVYEPAELTNPEHVILFITGGSIGGGPREDEMRSARHLANLSGMYAAVLWQVPNQPLLGGFTEDGLITETLLKVLETGDETWPLLFPMAKSAVRAMDAIQVLLNSYRGKNIKGFVVFGGSKRGWTSWMTAATKDPRVIAIAPMVYNILNMQVQGQYQMSNWGFYSEQIGDYSRRGLMADQIDPNASEEEKALRERMLHMIDPYFYRERLVLPKFLVHGTNDRYWNLDATKFYWDDLLGPKFLLNLPNVGHNLGAERVKALTSIAAFSKLVSDGAPFPSINWKNERKGDEYVLSVTSNIPAKAAKLWIAHNEGTDFREVNWTSSDLQPLAGSSGNFQATIKKPESGYVGYYIEVETEYAGIPCSLSTEIFNPKD